MHTPFVNSQAGYDGTQSAMATGLAPLNVASCSYKHKLGCPVCITLDDVDSRPIACRAEDVTSAPWDSHMHTRAGSSSGERRCAQRQRLKCMGCDGRQYDHRDGGGDTGPAGNELARIPRQQKKGLHTRKPSYAENETF